MILQWSESAPQMMPRGYQRSSRSFNMGPDVVHEKPRPLRFG
ncbi:Neuropeptide-Like Protein [Caenorhabditis elegans]